MYVPNQPSTKGLRPAPDVVYGKGGSQHSYSQEEKKSFTDYINYVLKDDPDMVGVIPMDENSDEIFKTASEGLLICKLVNALSPGTIDNEKIVKKKDPNPYEILSNISLALQGAKDLGCTLVNINVDDIRQGKPHIVLGFLWRLIRTGLLKQVTIEKHPELLHIIDKSEDVTEFVRSKPEANLLRWFNYHLKKAGHHRTVSNFKSDISDGENYLVLLEQIAPDGFLPKSLHKEPNPTKRVQLVCEAASALDALKFVSPDDISQGNEKLNLAFTAHLFNKYPGLDRQASQGLSTDELTRKQKEAEEADRQYQALLEEERRLDDEKKRIDEQMKAEEMKLKREEEIMRENEERLLREQEEMRRQRAAHSQSQSHMQNQQSQVQAQPQMQTQPPPQMQGQSQMQGHPPQMQTQPQMYSQPQFNQPQMQTQPPPMQTQPPLQMQTQPPPMQTQPPPLPPHMQSHQFQGQSEMQTQSFFPQNSHTSSFQNQQTHQWSESNIGAMQPQTFGQWAQPPPPYQSNIISSMSQPMQSVYSSPPPFQTIQVLPPPSPVAFQTQMVPSQTVVITSPPPPPPPPPPQRVIVTTTTTTFRRRR